MLNLPANPKVKLEFGDAILQQYGYDLGSLQGILGNTQNE